MSYPEILALEIRSLQIEVSDSVLQQLATYAKEIEHWNKTVNLTALNGAALVRRLIVEPVWAGQHLKMSGCLADVGSGNGSPGIPLRLTRNFSATHLIEPRMKRAAFLRHMVAKLGLDNVAVNRNRVEDIMDGTVVADWIVLQAIDPTVLVIESLRRIGADTTRVVWITSHESAPVERAERFEIPNSRTKIWVFGLDQI